MNGRTVYDRPGDVVEVTGPDAHSFLQSLVSQDLDGLDAGGSAHSLLLLPTGKVDGEFRVVRDGDAWLLLTDAGHGEALAASLRRFKIRVKAEIAVAERVWLPVRGEGTWPAGLGDDVIVDRAQAAATIDRLVAAGARRAGAAEYEAARIAAGVPLLGVDVDSSTIPQEALLDETAVSFEKGCFLGQELVCRIHDRGHVNRILRHLVWSDGAAVDPGTEVVVDGAGVGRVTSVGDGVALAYVRREVEPGAEVTVGSVAAVVEALPARS